MSAKTKSKKKTAEELLKPKRKVRVGQRKPALCAKAEELKHMREMITALEKGARILRDELIQEYGPGTHAGFSIVEKTRENLSPKLLEQELGDLAPYRVQSGYFQIDFH